MQLLPSSFIFFFANAFPGFDYQVFRLMKTEKKHVELDVESPIVLVSPSLLKVLHLTLYY